MAAGKALGLNAGFVDGVDERTLPRRAELRIAPRRPQVGHIAKLHIGDITDQHPLGVAVGDAIEFDRALAVAQHHLVGHFDHLDRARLLGQCVLAHVVW